MGAYTGTPTILRAWEEGDRNGKFLRIKRRISITLATQGGATNTISATSLGLKSDGLEGAQFVLFTDDSGSQKRALHLFTDGTYLYVGDPQTSTDADRGEPTDVSGVLVCEIYGQPAGY
jgi:hypothetical protein